MCWASSSYFRAPAPCAPRSGHCGEIEAVGREQRQGQAVDAEGDAAGMSDLAGFGAQIPRRAEMVAVIVEAHARGRLLGGAHRNQQFELQRLLTCAIAAIISAASKERIARGLDLDGTPSSSANPGAPSEPASRNSITWSGVPDADVFAHPERLQAVDVARGLAAEAIAGDVEHQPVGRHRPGCGDQRDRPGSRRRASGPDRSLSTRPSTQSLLPAANHRRRADLLARAAQATHAAEEMRKALRDIRIFDRRATHHRRKAQNFRAGPALFARSARQRFDDSASKFPRCAHRRRRRRWASGSRVSANELERAYRLGRFF